jgi:hypothetical protein
MEQFRNSCSFVTLFIPILLFVACTLDRGGDKNTNIAVVTFTSPDSGEDVQRATESTGLKTIRSGGITVSTA